MCDGLIRAKYYDDSEDDFEDDVESDRESDANSNGGSEMEVDDSLPPISSDESEDSFDEDLYRDDEDRRTLARMTDMDRQAILYERGEKRNQIRERNTLKAQLRAARGIVTAPKTKAIKKKGQVIEKAPKAKATATPKGNAKLEALKELKEKRLAASSEGAVKQKKKKGGEEDEDSDFRDSSGEEADDEGRETAKEEKKRGRVSTKAKTAAELKAEKMRDRHRIDSDEEDDDGSEILYDEQGRRMRLTGESTFEDILKMQVRRDELIKWIEAPHWDKTVKGAFVRASLGTSSTGENTYRLAEIIDYNPNDKSYRLPPEKASSSSSSNSSQWRECTMTVKLAIGASSRDFGLDRISNQPILQVEFDDWVLRMRNQQLSLPSKKTALRVNQQLIAARSYVRTEADIEREILKRQSSLTDSDLTPAERAAREKHSQLLLSINKRNRGVNSSVEAAYSPESVQDSALNPFARRPTLTTTAPSPKPATPLSKTPSQITTSNGTPSATTSSTPVTPASSSTPSSKIALSLDLDDHPAPRPSQHSNSHHHSGKSHHGSSYYPSSVPITSTNPSPGTQSGKVLSFAQYLGRR